MEEIKIYNDQEIAERLPEIPGWAYKDGRLVRQLIFKDFIAGLSFINEIANFFEEVDHHADMTINYNKITFELCRWDQGCKITNRDFLVANEIDRLYNLEKE
jgi:4a-hydroxytetrahydrobiopterin dehydratase